MTPESPLRGQVKDYPKLLSDFKTKLRNSLGSSPPKKPLRIGILTESFSMPGVSPCVHSTILQAATASFSALNYPITPISTPLHTTGPLLWTASTRPSMFEWACQGKTSGHLSYLAPHINPQWPPDQRMYQLLTSTNPALMNLMFNGPFMTSHFSPAVVAKAHRKIFELRAAYVAAFEEVDVLIAPCAPTVAMPHPDMRLDENGKSLSSVMDKMRPAIGVTSNTAPFNVTGHPGICVPCGVGEVDDRPGVVLPVGMQIVGRRWEDEIVLFAAAAFEKGRRLAEEKGKSMDWRSR